MTSKTPSQLKMFRESDRNKMINWFLLLASSLHNSIAFSHILKSLKVLETTHSRNNGFICHAIFFICTKHLTTKQNYQYISEDP